MLGPHVAISSSPLRAPTIVVFSTVKIKLSLPSVGSFESADSSCIEVVDCRIQHCGLDVQVVDCGLKRHFALQVQSCSFYSRDYFLGSGVARYDTDNTPVVDSGHQGVAVRGSADQDRAAGVCPSDQGSELIAVSTG